MRNFNLFVQQCSEVLHGHRINAWVIYIKKGVRSWILEKMGLENVHITRPLFFFFFPDKEPVVLFSELDVQVVQEIPFSQVSYLSFIEQRHHLQQLLPEGKIALDYIPDGILPLLSTVDAGFKEWIDRQPHRTSVSSALFIDEVLAKVNSAELASHRIAAAALDEILSFAFDWIGINVPRTERQVQEMIRQKMEEKGLVVTDPIVAFGKNSANPHYEIVQNGKQLEKGDVILIDLWSKQQSPYSIYADITGMGYLSQGEVPAVVEEVFACVKEAQDTAIRQLTLLLPNEMLRGEQVDQFARSVIESKGYGPYFRHRLGHNVGGECHGAGVNFDSLEFPDSRKVMNECIYTVEPGIYLAGQFGVRLECDLYIDRHFRVEVTANKDPILRILK